MSTIPAERRALYEEVVTDVENLIESLRAAAEYEDGRNALGERLGAWSLVLESVRNDARRVARQGLGSVREEA